MLDLSVIVPVYNEAATVLALLRQLRQQVEVRQIIVVDDGSSDATSTILAQYQKELSFEHLSHGRNCGKGEAICSAVAKATARYTIIQDADLEYDPADINRLYSVAIAKNHGAVFGDRFANGRPTNMRLLLWVGNRFLTWLFNKTFSAKLNDMETCYKLIETERLRRMQIRSTAFDVEVEIAGRLRQQGVTIAEIPISYRPRSKRQGKKIRAVPDGIRTLRRMLKVRYGANASRDVSQR